MIEIKEQYIEVDLRGDSVLEMPRLERAISEALVKSELNNAVLILDKKNDFVESLASYLEKQFQTSNGLACFVGVKDLMKENFMAIKEHVIALPTEHEGIEAIMMNILENDFLKGE